MSLSTVLEQIICFGLILWVIEAFVPMGAGTKRLLQVVVSIFLILWILQGLGLVHTNVRL